MKMRIVDGFVVDLSLDPDGAFNPVLAAEFVEVPEDAPEDLRFGYRYEEGIWTSPDDQTIVDKTQDVAYRTLVSVARFKSQFPLEAQIKVELARAYVPVNPAEPDLGKAVKKAGLDVLYGQLSDLNQAGDPVDVADPSVQKGVDWMCSQGFITEDDAERIKRGVPS